MGQDKNMNQGQSDQTRRPQQQQDNPSQQQPNQQQQQGERGGQKGQPGQQDRQNQAGHQKQGCPFRSHGVSLTLPSHTLR